LQELLEKERQDKKGVEYSKVDVDDLLDDPELAKIHEQRLSQIQSEREKRQKMSHKGHGDLTDITEGDFLEVMTKTELVVCHFFHRDFERCKIMDKHLKILAAKYFTTRFCRISAPDTPFFVAKLSVQLLPCVIFFVNGVAVDRVIGFDELGAKDDFPTEMLEARILACGVIRVQKVYEAEEPEQKMNTVRKGLASRGMIEPGDNDEDSDFD
jgi:thioredoxin-like negative regulator of GroEL